MSRVEITVYGRVQGVAFRWHTARQARAQSLTGWVRNQPDGSVRLVAEGPRPALDTFLAWVRQGPERADVAHHEVTWSEACEAFPEFTILG